MGKKNLLKNSEIVWKIEETKVQINEIRCCILNVNPFTSHHTEKRPFAVDTFTIYQAQTSFDWTKLKTFADDHLRKEQGLKPNQLHKRYCMLLKDRNDNLIIKSYRSMLQVST